MEIIDRITIESTPENIFSTLIFFFRNSENYRLWHQDHIACYWAKGKDLSPGSILTAEEYIHGSPHKLRFKLLSYKKNKFVTYKLLFPMSLISSGGFFKLIPKGNKTEFVAQLKFKFGTLLKWLFKEKLEALRIHMKEEGENIKKFIEESPNQ